jgi:hypothetical protein
MLACDRVERGSGLGLLTGQRGRRVKVGGGGGGNDRHLTSHATVNATT